MVLVGVYWRGGMGYSDWLYRRGGADDNVGIRSRDDHVCRDFAVFVGYGRMMDHADSSVRMDSSGYANPSISRGYADRDDRKDYIEEG